MFIQKSLKKVAYKRKGLKTFIPLQEETKIVQREVTIKSGIEIMSMFKQVYPGMFVVLAKMSNSRSICLLAFISELAYEDGTFAKNEKFYALLSKFIDQHGFIEFTDRNVRDCLHMLKVEGIVKSTGHNTFLVNPLYLWGSNSQFRPEAIMEFYDNAKDMLKEDLKNTVVVAGSTVEKMIEKDGMFVKLSATINTQVATRNSF